MIPIAEKKACKKRNIWQMQANKVSNDIEIFQRRHTISPTSQISNNSLNQMYSLILTRLRILYECIAINPNDSHYIPEYLLNSQYWLGTEKRKKVHPAISRHSKNFEALYGMFFEMINNHINTTSIFLSSGTPSSKREWWYWLFRTAISAGSLWPI